MASANDVARYLIHLAAPSEDEDTDCLCHLRLQKLLYYIQGWHLSLVGVSLFGERIEAWKHGPVVKSLYPAFRDYGYQAIPPSQGADPASLTDREKAFVRAIWDLYKGYSATALRKMTHKEAPWLDARGSLPPDAISDAEITPESMRAFFLPRVIKRLQQQGPRIDPTAWASSAEAIATGRARTTKDIRDELRRRRAGPNPG